VAQLGDLAAAVVGVGPGTSLSDKVSDAQAALANGSRRLSQRSQRAADLNSTAASSSFSISALIVRAKVGVKPRS